MLISLNWLGDFVDLPADMSARELADRLTMSTAEVEGVEQVAVEADGLIAAVVVDVHAVPERRKLTHVVLDVGGGQVDTITAAPNLRAGDVVVYAPDGATVGGIGKVGRTEVGGLSSAGMILPGDALGILQTTQEAVFLPPTVEPGSAIDLTELSDWVLEIDNKSITHRPDLWGHYGIAREVAALIDRPLRPYADRITPLGDLQDDAKPTIPIVIDDPTLCPRYSALTMTGLRVQPSPLWMQARLSYVGQRPIDLLVDLTNYVMFELGQPTHAFDGDKVRKIEVAVARTGEKFTTLDAAERELPADTLMIQSDRRNVALAGIMGGADTEVTPDTSTVLLESANFEPTAIRRAAAVMGHRTEASARFEKSLDPANTVLAIARFVALAREQSPSLQIVSTLSDCYPDPKPTVSVEVDLAFANRFIGMDVPPERVERILESLGLRCVGADGDSLKVDVPSFRSARDVTMEADVIEEISRIVGYDNIPAALPDVTMRSFPPVRSLQIERRSLELLCTGLGFSEIQTHDWYDLAWIDLLGYEPGECVEIAGESAGGRRLRQSLVTHLLAAVDLNRRTYPRFDLVTIGSVFLPEPDPVEGWPSREARRMGLAVVGRTDEDEMMAALKDAVETWARQVLSRQAVFAQAGETQPARPWEHPIKTAELVIEDQSIGRLTLVPLECRIRIDEHLRRWAIGLAEIDLDAAVAIGSADERLGKVPTHPQVQLDFSVVVEADRRYARAREDVSEFDHPLLRRITFVGSYEGRNIPEGRRSLTLRVQIGADDRTLTDDDVQGFQQAFTDHLTQRGLALRT